MPAEPQSQEFILPFVGREEELKFLLDEYDQMLHAQYRSVWIEAPAGMGKTTLVEEFLKRIDVAHPALAGCATSPLKPWIVHARLRERSTNSLVSFVEALGATLGTLTDAQREKLFSGLTSFYQERARKIVGGGNVQAMDMEEAITTAGYILKRLSQYFPVVSIIEDIHVLKGEISFYALRHLLAIVEHVPLLAMFISRPSDEKNIKQFRNELLAGESKKIELKNLREEDIKKLIETRGGKEKTVKELMRLSNGNALLLRELLRSRSLKTSGTIESEGSSTEHITRYLLKELGELRDSDRRVIALAGMLGEEFSEELLQEIAEAKHFFCWTPGVLTRLEQFSVLTRSRKELRPEPEAAKKTISLRVATFTHALWWEAARVLYDEEKKTSHWKDEKFAQAIVPLLSDQEHPLLTDAKLLCNLFQWTDRKKSLPLLQYVDSIATMEARWHFHSHEEQLAILARAHECIVDLLDARELKVTKEIFWMMLRLLESEQLVMGTGGIKEETTQDNEKLILKLITSFTPDDHDALKYAAELRTSGSIDRLIHHADVSSIESTTRYLTKLRNSKVFSELPDIRKYLEGLWKGLDGHQVFFNDPLRAAEYFHEAATIIQSTDVQEANWGTIFLSDIVFLPVPQDALARYVRFAKEYKETLAARGTTGFILRSTARVEIELCLKAGLITSAAEEAVILEEHSGKVWRLVERFNVLSTLAHVYAYQGERQKWKKITDEIFSEAFSDINEKGRFKTMARQLFLLEDHERFGQLWQTYKKNLFPYKMVRAIPVLESRILMCLLSGNHCEEEALGMLQELSVTYPAMKKTLDASIKKLTLFLSLSKSSTGKALEAFEKFLATDATLSRFDQAHYAELFVRIGAVAGHDPKKFSSIAKIVLKNFTSLGLARRAAFASEKFSEAGLGSLSRKPDHIVDEEKEKLSLPEFPPPSNETNAIGNRLRMECFGDIKIIAPGGDEIISRYWGKREKGGSHHKRIVIELVRARLEHRMLTRKQILTALYPELRRGDYSENKIARCDRNLAACFSQLKKTFSPFEIFEKVDGGYRLHSSVHVDAVEVEELARKAEMIMTTHVPSAIWLFHKIRTIITKGEFAPDVPGLKSLQEEFNNLSQKSLERTKTLQAKVAL